MVGHVFPGRFPATWVHALGTRGLKITWRNHLLFPLTLLPARVMECNETLLKLLLDPPWSSYPREQGVYVFGGASVEENWINLCF